ncbi:aminopeptidase N [uncultured Tolumonas sp.]|uniref:aminopeptidase N n=1 Tax=uncultured Tolumonas sp. TaxID=263765 RepID=UPI00292DFC2B|nr:aminopeptidase N [uncultured Tolumonas sp.]
MNAIAKEKHRLAYTAPDFTIDQIDLDILLDENRTTVIATSLVKRQGNHVNDLLLNGENLILHSVLINKQQATYRVENNQLCIENIPDLFELQIVTEINPEANSALEGLYKSGSAFCTQCEAEGFRRITYYLDRPDVLARFTTKITANKANYPILLSNGNRIASGDNNDGTHWVQWQDPYPKPCYLFALVAGDFDVLKDTFKTKSGRTVALELFVDKGNLNRSHHAMTSLKKSMAWDEQRFGLEYDLDIYMIVAVDFFNMGAMENKGLNVFNAKFVLANSESATDTDYFDIERVIGHEYFHNWTGNRITCRDWFQLSLKEGLTVFRDQEFSSDLGSRAINRIRNVKIIRGPQFAEDAGPMSHPIRPDVVMEMNNFYTLTVYEKGSEVIRMLHTILGENKFQAGMKLYVARHDGQAVTCDDFVQAMQDASGIDLTLFRRWYAQSGTPILTVSDEFDALTCTYRLHVKQHTPATADQNEKSALHIPLSIALYDQGGVYLGDQYDQVLSVCSDQQSFEFTGITEKPVIALLQDFSAPVKLEYAYDDQDLLILLRHSRSAFTRWDAAQMLINKYIKLNVKNFIEQQPLEVPPSLLHTFAEILRDQSLDKSLIAEIMRLPSESSIAELFDEIDIDAIHTVRRFMEQTIAQHLHDVFVVTYQQNKATGSYELSQTEIAKRDLVAVCLNYLAINGDESDVSIITAHYDFADNMTDILAAMQAAKQGELPVLQNMMTEFETKWHHDGLVMDNWFRIQATSPADDCLSTIKSLLSHRSFSMQNPNRLRALIGTFSAANPHRFHAIDGSGYRFLREILEELNTTNPQVAARLITPLLQYKRFDSVRQSLMKQELQQLAERTDLSNDLFEKVSRALAQ